MCNTHCTGFAGFVVVILLILDKFIKKLILVISGMTRYFSLYITQYSAWCNAIRIFCVNFGERVIAHVNDYQTNE